MGRFGVCTLVLLLTLMDFGGSRAGLAQTDDIEPVLISGASGRSVQENVWVAWWAWIAPATGAATFDTAGTAFDTLLVVVDGPAQVASNLHPEALTLGSEARFTAQRGRLYNVVATRFDGGYAPGTIVLNWQAASAGGGVGGGHRAGSDDFAYRAAISGVSGRRAGSNVGAGIESGEPTHAGNSGGASVWWTWTAPAGGEVAFDTFGSSFDTLLAVYTGSSLDRLTEVASNDDAGRGTQSEVGFTAQRGRTYHIAVDGYGGASGAVALNWWLAPTGAAPAAPLREEVFEEAGKTVYVIAGDNGSLQYWMDASGIVEESLYESAQGSERVRTVYDAETGAPRTVLNEVSGHWLSIRGAAPGRVDFSAYDGDGDYLDGFAIYEKSGQYFTAEFVGPPADAPTTGVEDGLTNVQEVLPYAATLIDVLRGGESLLADSASGSRADAEAYSLHRGLTKGGLDYMDWGFDLLRKPGGRVLGARLLTAGAGAFMSALFLPDIANGIRIRFGRDCPPAGSFEGGTCAALVNLAANNLSAPGTTGPIGYLLQVEEWIKDAPSRLSSLIARGARSLGNVILGLLPGDAVRDRADAEPAPLRRGTASGTGDRPGTPLTDKPYLMCAAPIWSNVSFGGAITYELVGWSTSPGRPYVAYTQKRTSTDSRGTSETTKAYQAYCTACRSTGTFSYGGDAMPCSSFHAFAQSEWDYGYQDPVETQTFDCLPQWPTYYCGN